MLCSCKNILNPDGLLKGPGSSISMKSNLNSNLISPDKLNCVSFLVHLSVTPPPPAINSKCITLGNEALSTNNSVPPLVVIHPVESFIVSQNRTNLAPMKVSNSFLTINTAPTEKFIKSLVIIALTSNVRSTSICDIEYSCTLFVLLPIVQNLAPAFGDGACMKYKPCGELSNACILSLLLLVGVNPHWLL